MNGVAPRTYLHFRKYPEDDALIELMPEWQKPYVVDRNTSYEALAKQHNIAIGTAKSRVHRARAKLLKLRELAEKTNGGV